MRFCLCKMKIFFLFYQYNEEMEKIEITYKYAKSKFELFYGNINAVIGSDNFF